MQPFTVNTPKKVNIFKQFIKNTELAANVSILQDVSTIAIFAKEVRMF